MTLRSMARRIWTSAPRDIVRSRRQRRVTEAPRPLTIEFLRSPEYQELMWRHVPYNGEYGRHEAQTRTASFEFRHFEVNHLLRVFRWRGLQEHLDRVLEVLSPAGLLIADLGGAAGPLGLGSVVVDQLPRDQAGARVEYRRLADLPRRPDVVFTSHTLEHIPSLDEVLSEIATSLEPGGALIALVPAFSCERWRVGVHANAEFGDHVWTFGLRNTPNLPRGLRSYLEIDEAIARHLHVTSARYVGDDSILVFADSADS